MRLYSKTGASQVDDPRFGSFTPGPSGAFDGLPDAMYADLHGRPGWESEAERATRLATEELEKFRDPASLLAEVRKLGENQGALAAVLAAALGLPGAGPLPGAAPVVAPAAPAVEPVVVESVEAVAPVGAAAEAGAEPAGAPELEDPAAEAVVLADEPVDVLPAAAPTVTPTVAPASRPKAARPAKAAAK